MEEFEAINENRVGETTVTETDSQYFEFGKVRIKISEHFATSGKTLDCVLEDVIQHAAIAS